MLTTKHKKDISKKFWEKVKVRGENECWDWIAAKCPKGYGLLRFNNNLYKAHRLSWRLRNGEIPKHDNRHGTLYVLHKCDNPSCVNHSHLWVGTQKDNMRDCVKKGRFVGGGGVPLKRGEDNISSKLTKKEVRKIKKDLKNPNLSQKQIAKKFKVTAENISAIKRGITWTHVKSR